ncbi:hypothetical protein RSOLAG1IB_08576 [Rhizoctonia solani AG-1 IB]|uniref:Uncharacterized protein n=1 Tax=Thanatephorus cucumeris (strain AG1-IB / isolate 7/3/14) TaxID=1108050 RepID=M5C742_THACB|nr:hypothetical protein BN14_09903 [Rhizoctonia solani AG-1 IB]CEL58485.1 hypothetical protein RSOLAG1IB_08576 [Rhizoctonia solani AG-1 IB]
MHPKTLSFLVVFFGLTTAAPIIPSGHGSGIPPQPTGSMDGQPPHPTDASSAPTGPFSGTAPTFSGMPSGSFSGIPSPPSGVPPAPSNFAARAFNTHPGSENRYEPSGAFSGIPPTGTGALPANPAISPHPSGLNGLSASDLPSFSGVESIPWSVPIGAASEISSFPTQSPVQARAEPSSPPGSFTGHLPEPTGGFSGIPPFQSGSHQGPWQSGSLPIPSGLPPTGAPSGTPESLIQARAEPSPSVIPDGSRPPRPSGVPSFSGAPPAFSGTPSGYTGRPSGFSSRLAGTPVPPAPSQSV